MTLDGLPTLTPVHRRVLLQGLEVKADIGFHDHEVGAPQRIVLDIEIVLADGTDPAGDEKADAWNYDFVREEVMRIATARRYNLQETLVRTIFDRIAAVKGVKSLRVRSVKPDIYPDAAGVGVEYASD